MQHMDHILYNAVLQTSKVNITTNQPDIWFPGNNDVLFINATFSSSDASIFIPGAFILERGKNGNKDSPLLEIK